MIDLKFLSQDNPLFSKHLNRFCSFCQRTNQFKFAPHPQVSGTGVRGAVSSLVKSWTFLGNHWADSISA